jgi:hypothetical protein
MSFIGRMFGGGRSNDSGVSSAPAPQAISAPAPPLLGNRDMIAAGDAARSMAGDRQGRQSTILTGPFGMPISPTPVSRKTLLGQ